MKTGLVQLRVAACLGFLAVALGAFGAHALRGGWEAALPAAEAARRVDVWRTAELYHLTHAVALLALALAGAGLRFVWAWRCWIAGVVLFSGSLYLWAVTAQKWLVFVTPVGGVLLLAGWLSLALCRRGAE
jgi:uncharacterized membrane protein YgdD (TMEM256/DUF423 family)